jgi:hypothetical protein
MAKELKPTSNDGMMYGLKLVPFRNFEILAGKTKPALD